MRLGNWLLRLFDKQPRVEEKTVRKRGAATHVIILDGTNSSLRPEEETSAGLIYKLLRENGYSANMTLYYEAGIQWKDWTETFSVVAGRGINRQIERAYGALCSRWREGDGIVLIGFSRGAFAVRSLAGVIDRVGLVRSHHANERNIRQAYRYYSQGTRSPYAEKFSELHCTRDVTISALGCFDTVKSLGLRVPLLWKLEEERHSFHSDGLVPAVKSAFHALALHENRDVFAPEIWKTPDHWSGEIQQAWFRGSHGDVGGHITPFIKCRPLSNIPLVWMLEKLGSHGLPLPAGWRQHFPCDPHAPEVGLWVGWGKLFLLRHKRVACTDPSEFIHETAELPPPPRHGFFGFRTRKS